MLQASVFWIRKEIGGTKLFYMDKSGNFYLFKKLCLQTQRIVYSCLISLDELFFLHDVLGIQKTDSDQVPIDHCAYQPVGLVLQLLSISACFLTLCWWRLQLLMITLQTVILNFCSHVVDFLLHYYRTKDNRKFLSDAITLFLHYSLFRKWNLQSHLILYEM